MEFFLKLAIIFLNKVEYLEDLLTAFLEIGINGATVVNSVGMGRIISYEIPIFAGLQEAFPGSSPSNKTIFAVIKDEKVKKVLDVVEDICGSFEEPGSGLVVTLPVSDVYGLRTSDFS